MIYTSKFFESAVEDAIQDPNNVGVDLDQVEKAIAGDNGIEAHIDDVEAAQDGTIGDPVEEVAMIIFESEYNYNQIMQAIGVAELREASMGRELIFEAADIKGFFKKIKDFLIKSFEKITKVVRDLLAKMDLQAKADKKFVTTNAVRIRAGAKSDWGMEGYVFPETISMSKMSKSNDIKTVIADAIEDLKNESNEQIKAGVAEAREALATFEKDMLTYDGLECSDLGDYKEKIKEAVFGKKVNLKGKVTAENVIKVLSEDRETRKIRDEYNNIKKGYKANLDAIKRMESRATSNPNTSAVMTLCEIGTRGIKFESNCMNIAYSVLMKAAAAKRKQYRALAHHFYEKSKGITGKNEGYEMTNSLFDKIDIV